MVIGTVVTTVAATSSRSVGDYASALCSAPGLITSSPEKHPKCPGAEADHALPVDSLGRDVVTKLNIKPSPAELLLNLSVEPADTVESLKTVYVKGVTSAADNRPRILVP